MPENAVRMDTALAVEEHSLHWFGLYLHWDFNTTVSNIKK